MEVKKEIAIMGKPRNYERKKEMSSSWSSESGRILFIITITTLLFLPVVALADEGADPRIEKLEAAVKALQEELAALKAEKAKAAKEAAPPMDQKQIEQLVSKTLEQKKNELPPVPDWVRNIKFFGDLRYRHETIEAEHDGKPDTQRNRIRVRLGMAVKLDPEFDLGFRLASGANGDPTTTNQTLGDSFSKKEVRIDWAYFGWHPETVKGLNVLGGKFVTPFYAVGGNQLIWDSDLSVEGGAATYKMPLAADNELFLNTAALWVEERETAVDTSLWGAQAGLKHYFDGEKKKQYLLGGLGWYNFGNIKGQPNLEGTWKSSGTNFFGNTSTGGLFVNDFDIFETFGEYGFELGKTPLSIFGDFVQNTAAETSGDTGWLTGFTFNKAKDPDSWEFGYNYRDIQADAVVGALNDSDFIGGGTGGRGHYFTFAYQWTKNMQAGLTYFLNERNRNGVDNSDYRRLQADVVLKF